ncbi:MAG: hypothetical protein ACYDCC_13190 [Actinomycetota bacterium]
MKSYEEVRAESKAQKKANRAARKAAKPKGIDFPIWKMMPAPLLIVFLVAALAAIATVVVVLINPPQPKIAVAQRRSPPAPGYSHDVGQIIPAPVPTPMPKTVAPCSALRGVVIEGGPPAQARIGGVLQRMCPLLSADPGYGQSVQALKHAHIRFAAFARTGDPSTLVLGPPTMIYINFRFARHDQSAMYIAPLLAHEGFHLLHRSEPFNASQELDARTVELEACRLLIAVDAWPRECTDAQQLIDFGRSRAIQALEGAGFPS